MARQFLGLPNRPTGVCIVNDYVALAFMVETMRSGLSIPSDVSVVSHDNQPIAAYCPVPLTSVTHPVKQIVSVVVGMLSERIDGLVASDIPGRTVVVRGELAARESVARVG
jgi:DNA-binding LacI/PurR family transcriptional regulator